MPQCTVSDALKMAERLRVALEAYRGKSTGGADFEATVSIGVTDLRQGDEAVTVVGRADRAMYQSKELGRNRVTAVWVR